MTAPTINVPTLSCSRQDLFGHTARELYRLDTILLRALRDYLPQGWWAKESNHTAFIRFLQHIRSKIHQQIKTYCTASAAGDCDNKQEALDNYNKFWRCLTTLAKDI